MVLSGLTYYPPDPHGWVVPPLWLSQLEAEALPLWVTLLPKTLLRKVHTTALCGSFTPENCEGATWPSQTGEIPLSFETALSSGSKYPGSVMVMAAPMIPVLPSYGHSSFVY